MLARVTRDGTTRVRVHPDEPALRAWLDTPRHDLVSEERGEFPGEFVQAHGPFTQYRRRVVTDAEGRLTETLTWRLDIPWFGWLFRAAMLAHDRRRHRLMSAGTGPTNNPPPPWWAPPERLDARQVLVLGLLAAASMSSAFVNTLFTQTVAFAADEFTIGESGQGIAAAIVRLGVLITLPATWLADHHGRRRVILATAWTAPIVSAVGALSPSFPFLVATQTIARPLALALDVIIAVVAVEEMPRGARAYAISVLAMASGLGAGVAVMSLPLADISASAWRLVYVVALIWMFVAVDVARRLPETQRFQHLADSAPAQRVRRIDRRRFAMLAGVAVLTNLFVASASIFQIRFLRDERGYSATTIAIFTLATATPAALGLIVGGRLADRRGRRVLASVGVPLGAVVLAGAFATRGAVLWFSAFLGGLISTIAFPALAVYRRELFPTGGRGRANGLLVGIALAGGSLGLVIAGALLERDWSYATVMVLLASASLPAGLIVWLGFPETARRELEELNPGDRPPPTA